MDFLTWLNASDMSGMVALASLTSLLPMGRQPSVMTSDSTMIKKDDRARVNAVEKELGPPSFDDFMELWHGLYKVRRSEYYGLAQDRNRITPKDVHNRIGQLCRRAGWGAQLEKKLVRLALKKDENAAASFYPKRGFGFSEKSKLTHVEAKKVAKYLKKIGLVDQVGPIFEHTHMPQVFARAVANQVGNPNQAIVRSDNVVTYEFYSLDVGQVLTEQGRYDLMKGCAEIRTDSKLGLAEIRIFQRWHTPVPGDDDDPQFTRPHLTMDEEYFGHVFMQDDVMYALAFRVDKNDKGKVVEFKADDDSVRRNMISLVLSGFSRDSDGFHRKLTGGQLGQGIGGTTGVLAAPCVFYRASGDRIADIQARIKEYAPKVWKELSAKDKSSINYETLKTDSRFINLMNGVPQSLAAIMADLDVPMPLPESDEERGPQLFQIG